MPSPFSARAPAALAASINLVVGGLYTSSMATDSALYQLGSTIGAASWWPSDVALTITDRGSSVGSRASSSDPQLTPGRASSEESARALSTVRLSTRIER